MFGFRGSLRHPAFSPQGLDLRVRCIPSRHCSPLTRDPLRSGRREHSYQLADIGARPLNLIELHVGARLAARDAWRQHGKAHARRRCCYSGYLKAVWLKIFGPVLLCFRPEVDPGTPVDRRGLPGTSICTKNQLYIAIAIDPQLNRSGEMGIW